MRQTYVLRYSEDEGRNVLVPKQEAEPLHEVMVIGDIEGYESPVTGLWVEGRRQRREDMKRSGCREYEPSEKQEMFANRERELDRQERRDIQRMRWIHA